MDSPLLHVANVLYLASYSVRDILWLRVLTVLAMLCLGWCYIACGAFNALWWQVAFLIINLVQIGFLLHERRPVQLTEIQQKLFDGPLRSLTPRQVQRFTAKAEWVDFADGERLISENIHLESLIVLLSGEAVVRARGREIAKLQAGQYAGEMSFLTGGTTTAEVVAKGAVRCARWPEKYVTEMIARDKELGTAIQAALGTDLVQKLLASREEE